MSLATQPLLTHELGSLAKPAWRVKAHAGRPLSVDDVDEARIWGVRLSVPDHDQLLELLERQTFDAAERREIGRWASRYALRFLESAGLDVVYDGEQQRSEMYHWAAAHAHGLEFRGTVRSFDDKYYSKAAVVGPISLTEPYHTEEFAFLATFARTPLKVPITGAYTLADWSYDEHYFTDTSLLTPASRRRDQRRAARNRVAHDFARGLIRPNIEALLALGATWIQLDEPGASTQREELELFVEVFNASVEGLEGFYSTHLCFSDYDLFFPAIEAMTRCQQFAVGFANDDSREEGTTEAARPGYRTIAKFRDLPQRPVLGLGVLDIHSDFLEPPELVRDRVLHAVDVFDDPGRIHVTPDCGLRTRSLEVAYRKLQNMVEGVQLAKAALGL